MIRNKIGILGGLGPFATISFTNLLFSHFQKIYSPKKDQDFPEISVEFTCKTPDRNAFILGNSVKNPLEKLIIALRNLENCGCNIIAIPCNTAHFFIDDLNEAKLPTTKIVNMVEETALRCLKNGYKKPLLLATKGTINSNLYKNYFTKFSGDLLIPTAEDIDAVMEIIYGRNGVKVGNLGLDNAKKLKEISDKYAGESDIIILGCTELPLVSYEIKTPTVSYEIKTPTIDPMMVLAEAATDLLKK